MQSATEFITERGSTDFQMNEISERCDLSKGALYYYFIDKQDLMDAIYEQVIGDLVDAVEQAAENVTTPLEGVFYTVLTLVECIVRERPLVFAMVEELFLSGSDIESSSGSFSRVLDQLVGYLEDARVQGLLHSNLNSRLVGNALAGACIYTALASVSRSDDPQAPSVEDRVREYLLMVMSGAATEKGMDYIRSYKE